MDVSKSRGDWIDPALGQVRFGPWATDWLMAQAHLKPSTWSRYELALRRQALPTWSRTPLQAITHADVAAWVRTLLDAGLAPGTVRYAFRVFSLILAHAVRDGRIPRNPAAGLRLPRVTQAEKTFLTHEQVGQLAAACHPYELTILTLAYTGLRWGEMSALRVRDVDLQRRRIVVARAITEVKGRVVVGTPKSHQRRMVPLPQFICDLLRERVVGRDADDLLFTSPEGEVLRNGNFRRRVFDPAARTLATPIPVTPHGLRHTAASLAIASGANVKVIQQMLGHASAAMTLDVYADLFADDLNSVAERLDEAYRSRRDSDDGEGDERC